MYVQVHVPVPVLVVADVLHVQKPVMGAMAVRVASVNVLEILE